MTTDVASDPLLLDATAAAKLLGLNRRTFHLHDAKGLVPRAVQLGRRRYWSSEELRSWIQAGCPPRVRWETMKGATR